MTKQGKYLQMKIIASCPKHKTNIVLNVKYTLVTYDAMVKIAPIYYSSSCHYFYTLFKTIFILVVKISPGYYNLI